uniref:Tudor domain-containing protein n=1 Tax=Strongyloides papillosus TaxID=174720 RepID=A0A0N5B8I1_STREA
MVVSDLLKQIFISRNNNKVDDLTLLQLEILLKQGYPVYIHTILREDDTNMISIEVFSIHLTPIKEGMKTLPNIFLKNALNSFLYFSQFNAWLVSKVIPVNIKHNSRISLQKTLSKDIKDCIVEKKCFPLTIIDNNVVNVSVEYLKGNFPSDIKSKYPIAKEVYFNSLAPENSVAIFGNNYKFYCDHLLIIEKKLFLKEFIERGINFAKMPTFSHVILRFNKREKTISLLLLQKNKNKKMIDFRKHNSKTC